MGTVNRRDRGTGCLYRRGNIYWIKYHRNGKPYYEDTHSDKKEVALRLLNKRLGEIEEGRLPGIYFQRVTLSELAEDLLADYQYRKRRSLDKVQRSIRYLKEGFGKIGVIKAMQVTTDNIKGYINMRRQAGLSEASINRELAALKKMFHLASKNTPPKVAVIPYIPMFQEDNARQGFFEHEEFLAIRNALPDYLKSFVTFAYHTGWRVDEVRNLEWKKVDELNWTVTIDWRKTKNKETKVFPLNSELRGIFETLYKDHQSKHKDCLYVFNAEGKKIRDFRAQWKKACLQAGLCEVLKDEAGNPIKDGKGNEIKIPTKIFHDLRRTAVRNMIRSGIPESVAMKISGHKTPSVFKRYDIVAPQDLLDASKKIETYHRKQQKRKQKDGVIVPFPSSQVENAKAS